MPPSHLQALSVGETLSLDGTPVTITRIAQKPFMFVLRNFLPPEDCQTLIQQEEAQQQSPPPPTTTTRKEIQESMEALSHV